MKTINHSERSSLRFATSVSLALLAMASLAHAQGPSSHAGTPHPVTEIVHLRSGTDANGVGLPVGSSCDDITNAGSTNGTNFSAALGGSAAYVIAPNSAWITSLADPEARWIHRMHSQYGTDGTGLPSSSVLYAQGFDLPLHMPSTASVKVELEFAADDRLAGLSFNTGTVFTYNNSQSYGSSQSMEIFGSAGNLGLVPGKNNLFLFQSDTGGGYSGLIYSITVTVDYCTLDLELVSGYRQIGWGMTQANVGQASEGQRLVVLPDSHAYNTLAAGGGASPVVVAPHLGWAQAMNSEGTWIHAFDSSQSPTQAIGGTGRPACSVLYAHDFFLPSLPSSAQVFIELEWAAGERLRGVSINEDVTSSGGELGVGTSSSTHILGQMAQVTDTAGALGLVAGPNMLVLSQEDLDGVCSGLMYNAKLTIGLPCGWKGGSVGVAVICTDHVGCPGSGSATGKGCTNSTGAGAGLTGSGVPTIGDTSTFELHVDNLPTPQTIGLFFEGDSLIPPTAFGDGVRCVGGDIKRLGVVISGTGRADSGILYGPSSPGVRYYQFWYRDSLGPGQSGFNLSNAIAVAWE